MANNNPWLNEIIEILTNVKIETVYDDNNEFLIAQDIMLDDKFRKILNIEITEEKLHKAKKMIDEFNKKNNTVNNNKNNNSSKTPYRKVYDVCFKKAERSYYEGLNLHAGFIYYIIQNVFLGTSICINKSIKLSDSIVWIYGLIFIAICAVYIFWKLFYKKPKVNVG